MTDFQDFEPADLASMRMTLADGRVFTFTASDDGAGKSLSWLPMASA